MAVVDAPSVRPWAFFGGRNFVFFWLSQSISGLGDQLTVIALAAVVWQLTHSSLFTALGVVVTTIPHALLGFFAGPIADSYGRKRVLVMCDLIRAATMALIPLAFALQFPLAVVFLLVLIATVCASLFTPTKLAILPDLVEERFIVSANSFVQLSDRTLEIVGKAIAGVLFLTAGTFLFYVDALTFGASALLLSRIALNEGTKGDVSLRSVLADAGTGLHTIGGNAILSANLFFSLLAQVSVAVLNTLIPVFLFREFRAGPDAFGEAEAILAAGIVLSSAFMPFLMSRVRKGNLVVIGFALLGLALIGLSAMPRLEGAFVLLFLTGVANAIFLIPNITIYQEHTPAEYRGRVFSTRYALLNLVWLPVMVVSGALAESMSTAVLIGIAGAFTVVVAAAGWSFRSVRDVR